MPDAPTPETGTPTPAIPAPATPEPATPAPQSTEPIQLPDDHPLVKAYAATKAKLKEHDDAQLSEMEKLTNSVGEQTSRAEAAEARVALLEAAIEHGLSMDDLALLGSGSPEEIAERAKGLAARLAESGAARRTKGATVPAEGRTPPPATQDPRREFLRDLTS